MDDYFKELDKPVILLWANCDPFVSQLWVILYILIKVCEVLMVGISLMILSGMANGKIYRQ